MLTNVGDFLLRVLDITGLRGALMIQQTTQPLPESGRARARVSAVVAPTGRFAAGRTSPGPGPSGSSEPEQAVASSTAPVPAATRASRSARQIRLRGQLPVLHPQLHEDRHLGPQHPGSNGLVR